MTGSDSTGVGMLGSGFMAHTYAECLARHIDDAHLVAVALGTRAPALAEAYDVAQEPTAEALLARDDIDLVVVATPHSTHVELASAVAAAGKHVYLEKPMAVDVAGCDAIIEACATAGVLLTVNKVTRYRESPLAAHRLIDEGTIGELRMIRATSSVVDYQPARGGWAGADGEGGAWLDMGVHLFDALRWFSGQEARTIYARIDDYSGVDHLRRSGMAELRLGGDIMAQVWISLEMPAPGIGSQNQWTIVGSDGIVECDSYGRVRLGRGDGWEDVHEMPAFKLDSDYRDPVRLAAFATQLAEFAADVRAGRTPVVGGADGRAAVELVEAARISSGRDAAVHLPLDVGP